MNLFFFTFLSCVTQCWVTTRWNRYSFFFFNHWMFCKLNFYFGHWRVLCFIDTCMCYYFCCWHVFYFYSFCVIKHVHHWNSEKSALFKRCKRLKAIKTTLNTLCKTCCNLDKTEFFDGIASGTFSLKTKKWKKRLIFKRLTPLVTGCNFCMRIIII